MVHISKWQIGVVLAVLLAGLLFAAPNLVQRQTADSLPDWLPREQINLGLDLQGGSYLLLEADIDAVIKEQIESLVDGIRIELRKARIGYTNLGTQGEEVIFKLRDPATREDARQKVIDVAQGMTVTTEDDGSVHVAMSDQSRTERLNDILSRSIEIVRRRIDETGTREPSIQRQGDIRILVQLPGVRDPERIKALLGKTAKLSFRFVEEDVRPGVDPVPAGAEVLPMAPGEGRQGERELVIRKRVMVSGDTLTDAQASYQNNSPVVSFRFDTVGAKRFADATRDNVGRRFAIVLDDQVISAPVIREPILGGSGVISGSFTAQQVQDLALLLRAGALPAPLNIIEERSVGPGLGADSIAAGKIASLLGLVFVVVFMAATYGLFGLLADVALLVNLVLIVAALSVLQATLTLPGIAGIVLTIGMAVDANVLIFERIREEVRNGRGPVSAIDSGYRRAMTTIIDANLTTLIAAVLLFQFGTGPVKGFAVTLTIGLVTSMFTAIMLTRLLVVTWLRQKRPQALPI